MSISNLYSFSGFKNRNKGHFAAIVRIALSDDFISVEEKEFLHRLAINLEIDENEVNQILENPDEYPINPPSTNQRRMERLFDLSRMVYADKIIEKEERVLLKKLVIGLGFKAEEASAIVDKSLSLILKGVDETEFIDAFKSRE